MLSALISHVYQMRLVVCHLFKGNLPSQCLSAWGEKLSQGPELRNSHCKGSANHLASEGMMDDEVYETRFLSRKQVRIHEVISNLTWKRVWLVCVNKPSPPPSLLLFLSQVSSGLLLSLLVSCPTQFHVTENLLLID